MKTIAGRLLALLAAAALADVAAAAESPRNAEWASPRDAHSPAGEAERGPIAGDWPRGWPLGRGILPPKQVDDVPWLRSATAARAMLSRLPEDDDLARRQVAAAIAMIVARRGFVFEEPKWRRVFEGEAWYVPSAHYAPERLMQGERQALTLLTLAFENLASRPARAR